MQNWIPVTERLPSEGQLVKTAVLDQNGIRNEALLWRKGSRWLLPDCPMYVYYAPTHWKPL